MKSLQMTDQIETRVRSLLREVMPWQFAKKQITAEMQLQRDLGIDSMGLVALVFRLEEEFGINVEEFSMNAANIRKVEDLLVAVKGSQNGA